MTSPGIRALPRTARFALLPVLAFLALAVWAVSSPVGSSPDEDWHLASIWCGQGTEQGVCEATPQAGERKVPATLLHAANCYAFHPSATGNCQDRWFGPQGRTLVATDRGNFNRAYPPAFYFTMHFFVGSDVKASVITMRLVNSALFVGLMTATFWLLPRRRRVMLVFGAGVALVPLGVFLIPSINASSWAITSAAVLFPALVGFFDTGGRRRIALGGLAVLATVMGAGARADAAVYCVIGAVLATFLAYRPERRGWRLLALPLLVCVLSGVFYLTSGQSSIAATGLAGSKVHAGLGSLILANLLDVPSLWAGALGTWGLGWLDTTMPGLVWTLNLLALGGVVLMGLRDTDRRKTIALVLALGAAWLIPTLILVQSHDLVGGLIQPRYVLPLVVLLVEVALFRVSTEGRQASRAQLVTVAGILGLTNVVALYTNLRRYVMGLGVSKWNLDAGPKWWWHVPVPPMVVCLAGGAAFAGAAVLCAVALSRKDDDAGSGATAGALWPSRTGPASDAPPRRAAA